MKKSKTGITSRVISENVLKILSSSEEPMELTQIIDGFPVQYAEIFKENSDGMSRNVRYAIEQLVKDGKVIKERHSKNKLKKVFFVNKVETAESDENEKSDIDNGKVEEKILVDDKKVENEKESEKNEVEISKIVNDLEIKRNILKKLLNDTAASFNNAIYNLAIPQSFMDSMNLETLKKRSKTTSVVSSWIQSCCELIEACIEDIKADEERLKEMGEM